MRPHQNAFCTLVYMIECTMYLCALSRMQWVLLCTQLASPLYFDVHRISFETSSVHKTSALTSNRISLFYESNVSVILSLTQIIKITGKYISLCNFFTLSCIKFTFAMDRPWDGGHSHLPHCYGNWVAMATRVKPQ